MTVILHGDFETRSTLELPEVGLHNYARHPTTDVWCLAYAFGDDEPSLWTPGQPVPSDIVSHLARGGEFYAHNAPFELEIWNEIMAPRYGWPGLPVEQTHCTMAMGYAMGLPGGLEDVAQALGLRVLKDTVGRALMLRMARPRSKAGVTPVVWWDDEEKRLRLYEYCRQDVRVEREVHKRLMPLSTRDRRLWLIDYKINKRGVAVDVEVAAAADKMAQTLAAEYDAKISAVTGGAVQTIGAVAALNSWLVSKGVPADKTGLAKQAVADFLDGDGHLPADARAALTLRQEGAKASAAKFHRMVTMAGADGRVRNMYQIFGAASRRWAGRGLQTHNLVRDMPPADVVEEAFDMIRRGQYELLDLIHGSPLTLVSRSIRGVFVPAPGKLLVGGDWSAIEGRGGAWFGGEEWKLEAFRLADAKKGPGMYELTYARMFGVPVETIGNPSPERQIGKVCDLSFLYQGGVGSGRAMGKNYGVKLPDATWDDLKNKWRDAHPRIAGERVGEAKDGAVKRKGGMWRAVENAAINAVLHPGEAFTCGAPGREATFKKVGSFLWLRLPSGDVQCFPYPKLIEGMYGPQLTYMTVPDPNKPAKIIADEANGPKWARVQTYGGALFNRIVQGFCASFLMDLMLVLDEKGAQIVLHTHDDCNIEVEAAKAEGARIAMQELMNAPPAWAKDFPLYAKCVTMKRYGKG